MTNNLISDILFLHLASLKSRCFLFIFILLVFILDFRLVRKLFFLYFNVNGYLKEIPCLNKVTLPYLRFATYRIFSEKTCAKRRQCNSLQIGSRHSHKLPWVPEVFLACHGREFSVLAEGRQIFGCRPKPRAVKLFARVNIKT